MKGVEKKINKAREEETERRDQRGGRRERKLTEQTGRGKNQKIDRVSGGGFSETSSINLTNGKLEESVACVIVRQRTICLRQKHH